MIRRRRWRSPRSCAAGVPRRAAGRGSARVGAARSPTRASYDEAIEMARARRPRLAARARRDARAARPARRGDSVLKDAVARQAPDGASASGHAGGAGGRAAAIIADATRRAAAHDVRVRARARASWSLERPRRGGPRLPALGARQRAGGAQRARRVRRGVRGRSRRTSTRGCARASCSSTSTTRRTRSRRSRTCCARRRTNARALLGLSRVRELRRRRPRDAPAPPQLEANPSLVPAQLLLARMHLRPRRTTRRRSRVRAALAVDSSSMPAWSLLGAIGVADAATRRSSRRRATRRDG